jgi:hypothetical protein
MGTFKPNVKEYIEQNLLVTLHMATYSDLSNLLYLHNELPNFFSAHFKIELLSFIKHKIGNNMSECPQVEYIEIFFYLTKIKAFPINDEIWVKLLSSAPKHTTS